MVTSSGLSSSFRCLELFVMNTRSPPKSDSLSPPEGAVSLPPDPRESLRLRGFLAVPVPPALVDGALDDVELVAPTAPLAFWATLRTVITAAGPCPFDRTPFCEPFLVDTVTTVVLLFPSPFDSSALLPPPPAPQGLTAPPPLFRRTLAACRLSIASEFARKWSPSREPTPRSDLDLGLVLKSLRARLPALPR